MLASQDGRRARPDDPAFAACPRRRGDRMSNYCHFVAGGSLINLAASRLALRAPRYARATGLTRPNRSTQRLSCGRHVVPTAKTVGPSDVVAKHCVEGRDHLRTTATITTCGTLAAAARRWWNVLSAGFQLLPLAAVRGSQGWRDPGHGARCRRGREHRRNDRKGRDRAQGIERPISMSYVLRA
jgi:hypothetical protein